MGSIPKPLVCFSLSPLLSTLDALGSFSFPEAGMDFLLLPMVLAAAEFFVSKS